MQTFEAAKKAGTPSAAENVIALGSYACHRSGNEELAERLFRSFGNPPPGFWRGKLREGPALKGVRKWLRDQGAKRVEEYDFKVLTAVLTGQIYCFCAARYKIPGSQFIPVEESASEILLGLDHIRQYLLREAG